MKKNTLKILNNVIAKNQSYAQLNSIYYNENGFLEVTNNICNTAYSYDENKYALGKVTKLNKKPFVKYEDLKKSDVKKDNKQHKTVIRISGNSEMSNVQKLMNEIIQSENKPNTLQKESITSFIKQMDLPVITNIKKNTYNIKDIKNSVINNVNNTALLYINNSINKPVIKSNSILRLNAWVNIINGKVIPRNFGDDINFLFLPHITNCLHVKYNEYQNTKNYLMIGSVLIDQFVNRYTEVWGTGMLRAKTLRNKPNKVYAVRGPKTRDILIKSGIQCPEIYGDPALLLPYYYHPYVTKKHKIGLIPHHSHINSDLVKRFSNNKIIKIIDFTDYKNWKDIIKQILSCEFIVSESLHGLIISEAYKIPNIWVSFGSINQDFKYEDFFLSVGKEPYKPYEVTDKTKVYEILSLKHKYDNTFTLDINKLIESCPVKLTNLNTNNMIKPYTGKVLLCCIGKLENNYIREFVKYYKKIGFDNICLYDNNDVDGEHFEDVIKDYIDDGFVILKDVRGKELALIPSYTACYNEYKEQYDWIAYFDIDEFLHIDDNKNIKDILSRDIYNDRGINCIRICWKQFTDSNIIKCNGNYSVNKFKDFLPLSHPCSALSKIIIKTLLDNIEFNSPHGIWSNLITTVNTAGSLCSNSISILNKTWDNMCLYHYRFKTIEEFVLNKMIRLWPTKYLNGGKSGLNLNMFFSYNDKNKEKQDYAEYLLKKYNINPNL